MAPHPVPPPRRRRAAPAALALACVVALALGGCDSTRSLLGVDRNPPDEFRIVSRAPLTIPPDFQLRPPQPGAIRPQEGNVRDNARDSILGSAGSRRPAGPAGATPAETALLSRVNEGRADPDIRQTVDRETAQLAEGGDGYLLDKIMFWRKPEPVDEVVNAPAEAQRLRENAALGRPAVEGDTPTIQRRTSRGIFEGIF